MHPKKFSEYTPIAVADGNEIAPIVKAGANTTIALKNFPISTLVQNSLNAMQAAIDAMQNVPVPLGYLIRTAGGTVMKVTVNESGNLITSLYNPAVDGEMFAFGIMGVGIFE